MATWKRVEKQEPKWKRVQPSNEEGIGNIFSQFMRSATKNELSQLMGKVGQPLGAEGIGKKVGLGAIPAAEQIPTGIKEGFLSALAGVRGKEFKPSEVPEEYGAGFGRGAGHLLGQAAIAAPIAAATGGAGAAVGVPSLLSALLGTGIGYGATTPGNIFERGIAGTEAAAAHGIGKGIAHIAGGHVPIKPIVNRLKQAFNVPGLRQEAMKAAEDLEKHNLSVDVFKSKYANLNDFLEKSFGKKSVGALEGKQENMIQQKADIEHQLANAPESNMANMPALTEEGHQNLLQTAQQKAAQAEEQLNAHLGEGQRHHRRFGNRVNEIQGEVEAGNKAKYNTLEKNLADQNIELPNSRTTQDIMQDLSNSIKKSGGHENEESKALIKELDTVQGNKTVPARKLLAMYRTARDAEYSSRLEAKTNPSDEGRIAAWERAEQLKKDKDRLHAILEEGIGPENSKLLQEATNEFREKIAPLRMNSLMREIKKTGKVKGSILEKLDSTEEGHHLLQEMVKNDPELKRLIVGQHYAGKLGKLAQPNEAISEHLATMPETSNLIDEVGQTHQNVANIQARSPQAKQTNIALQQKQHLNELNRIMPELERNITRAKAARQKAANNKEEAIHLKKEETKAMQAYEEARKDRNRLLIASGLLLSGYGGKKALNKLGVL